MIPRCRSLPLSHVSAQTRAVRLLLPSQLLTGGKKKKSANATRTKSRTSSPLISAGKATEKKNP